MNVIASMGNDKKNAAARFLIYSFIGLLIFSIAVFSLLGIYMNRKSRDTICEVGEIYMSGMNEQMSGCLLYTSPSPRDTERSRMPSSA